VQIVIGLATLPSYDQTLEQLVAEAQSDPSVVAIEETVLSNNVALFVISHYPESAEFEEINIIQFFTLYDNNLYVLQFMLNAADLETLNPLLMQMHSSYQIID